MKQHTKIQKHMRNDIDAYSNIYKTYTEHYTKIYKHMRNYMNI